MVVVIQVLNGGETAGDEIFCRLWNKTALLGSGKIKELKGCMDPQMSAEEFSSA